MMRMPLAIVLALIVVVGCGVDSPTSTPSSKSKREVVEKIWPPGLEDDAPIQLSDDLLRSNYYVILDGSGSMKEAKCTKSSTKADVAKQALEEFSKTVPQNANLGLLVFDARGVTERVPLGNDNRDRFLEEVKAAGADSSTPLQTAITRGYEAVTKQALRQLGYGEYHLVIVTDGLPSKNEDPTSIVNKILSESTVIVHTIGFCIGTNHTLNRVGETLYKAADNPEELRQGLDSVLAEAPSFDVSSF